MKTANPRKRILLSGVFGPFGVDDAYGRKENIMELFHNQVTKAQGPASFRFHHRSFGLYFLAANVDADVTVLDFPSRRRFIREIKKGYDIVGISFITPNFIKAREMARLVRLHAPHSKIVLGGHGAAIEGLERLIDCDEIARGEGIRWLRSFLGQDPEAPVFHPALPSAQLMKIFGVPLFGKSASLLVPGLGCVNGCKFCCTSHFFGRTYTPYLATGKELFETACRIADERKNNDFFVMDENFLKDRERALELLECIERERKPYTFGIFSSAETLHSLGDLDALVRLGVQFVWIGVESKRDTYTKNRGTDFHEVIRELRRRGIAVMASAILFLEHHDPKSIWEDIDYAVSLEPDYLQFMQLGPMPGTALHDAYLRAGKMLEDVPYSERHGQDQIWFRHPEFTRASSRAFLKAAFQRDYRHGGASLLRNIDTVLRGYRYALEHTDPRVRRRAETFVLLRQMRLFLPAARLLAANRVTADMAKRLESEYRALFGRRSAKDLAAIAGVTFLAALEWAKTRFMGDVRQPGRNLMRYRWPEIEERAAGSMSPALARQA